MKNEKINKKQCLLLALCLVVSLIFYGKMIYFLGITLRAPLKTLSTNLFLLETAYFSSKSLALHPVKLHFFQKNRSFLAKNLHTLVFRDTHI